VSWRQAILALDSGSGADDPAHATTGSYTETTTLTILKHLFKFITNRWIEVGKASSPDLRPACSLLVLQSVNPAIVAKLRNATDQLTRRRVGLRIDDDVPFHAFEWLRDVVFLEEKVMVGRERSARHGSGQSDRQAQGRSPRPCASWKGRQTSSGEE
jgi:hypothetical protein